jgi:hypothetical protein
MLRVCCFCDKVCDATTSQGLRHDLHTASHTRVREDTVLSYTCCRPCLLADPDASVFRARQSRSPMPGYGATIEAHSR